MEVYFIIPLSRRRCLVMLVISLSTSNTPDPGATMITVWPVRPKLRSMWCLSKAETKNGENKMRNYQPGIETESNQGLHWVHSTFLCDLSNDLKKLAPVSRPIRWKTDTSHCLSFTFSRASENFLALTLSSLRLLIIIIFLQLFWFAVFITLVLYARHSIEMRLAAVVNSNLNLDLSIFFPITSLPSQFTHTTLTAQERMNKGNKLKKKL